MRSCCSSTIGVFFLKGRGIGAPFPEKSRVIKLSDSSVVEGDIINIDDRRDVLLILEDGSKVLGEIRNAQVQRR